MNHLSKFIKFFIPIVFLGFFLFNSCRDNSTNPIDDKNSISGSIVDEQGTPVPYAVLEVSNVNTHISAVTQTDSTDEDGKFMISKLPTDLSGLYINIKHPDFILYSSKLADFKTNCKSPIHLFHLYGCKGELKLYTYNKADSILLSDVELRLFKNGSLVRKAITQNGTFTFDEVCAGTYIIRLYKSSFSLIYDSVKVNDNDTLLNKYYMKSTQLDSCCHGTISITPLDSATQQPLTGASVKLYKGSELLNTIIYQNTPVIFTGICPGTYYAHVDLTGYNGTGIPINANCNDSIVIVKSLLKTPQKDTCCNGIYKVFLIDKSTNKAPAKSVNVYLSYNGTVIQTLTCNGSYVYFSKLCPGTYHVITSTEYYVSQEWDYTSTCNKFDTITKFLDPLPNSDSCCHGKIVVSIVDSNSREPIDSVSIYLSQNGLNSKNGITSGGKVTFTDLCPGNYSLYYGSKTGYTRPYPYSWNFMLRCNDSASFTRVLLKQVVDTCCNGVITVTIKNTNTGDLVDTANVSLSQNGKQISSLTTENGVAKFTGLCAGTYSLYYWKLNWYRSETPAWDVTMACNDNQSFTKNMLSFSECCNGKISGTVTDSISGSPLTNISVNLNQSSTKIGTVNTDANGYFEFTAICPGTYTLYTYNTDYNGYYITPINTGCNDTSNIYTIKLKKK